MPAQQCVGMKEHRGFHGHSFPTEESFVLASLLRDDVGVMLLGIDGYERPDNPFAGINS